MEVSGENLRFILGLKLRKFRNQRGLSLKQVAERTKLSLSFLSEIEKGKKYPKPEKLMLLAHALDVPFDDLVSLKLDEELDALTAFLDSPFLREFPFELFGITPRDFLDLVSHSPSKAGAFLRTFMEIAQGYDMRVEHFILAALRSYQKMYLNYFEDIEKAVMKFNREFGLQRDPPVDFIRLNQILAETYGYRLSETGFEDYPDLRGFRAIWIKGTRQKLVLNRNLLPVQKAFLVAREIGFCYLGLQERAATSSWIKVESFDQVLNNFRASYFAGAVLINRDLLRKDLAGFFHQKSWDGEAFRELMGKYQATPEMFLYRLSQIIPKFFHLREIYYLRFNSTVGSESYRLTKELNMSRVRVPHGIGLNEHYCRRWLSIS
ncbi:MAG: helix-turn-helix domain-containing protein, partial [Calditrichaeota bacterium]